MKYIITIILLVAISFSEIKPQLFPVLGGQRAGISTAQFLKIGVGGRATAMGDAFVAIANDVSALYWNPAGLTQVSRKSESCFLTIEWVVDINHDFVGAVYHLDDANTFGVSLTALSMDEMKVTTEYAPFGTGEYFGFSDIGICSFLFKKDDGSIQFWRNSQVH
jgi:long-subunit fatty acid transport protein